MKKNLVFLVVLFFISSALPISAQVKGVATVSVGDYSGLGYTAPTFSMGLGLQATTKRFTLDLSGDYSPNRKDSETAGWSAGAEATGFARFGIVLLGGCVEYSHTKAPTWSKDSLRPCLAAGLILPLGTTNATTRISIDHVFPGSDRSNDLDGERMAVRFELPHGTRGWTHRITLSGGMFRFHASNDPTGPQYRRGIYAISFSETFPKFF